MRTTYGGGADSRSGASIGKHFSSFPHFFSSPSGDTSCGVQTRGRHLRCPARRRETAVRVVTPERGEKGTRCLVDLLALGKKFLKILFAPSAERAPESCFRPENRAPREAAASSGRFGALKRGTPLPAPAHARRMWGTSRARRTDVPVRQPLQRTREPLQRARQAQQGWSASLRARFFRLRASLAVHTEARAERRVPPCIPLPSRHPLRPPSR